MPQWYKKAQKEENRKAILQALTKEPRNFGELLAETNVSRATLTSHLKDLQREEAVQKIYSRKRNRVVYKITEKALIEELVIEGMIHSLGVVATHYVLRAKLGLPNPISLDEEFENYLKDLGRSEISPQKLFNALEKKHPLVI